jgi:DNA-binding MarR family transcriptional regulator
LNTPQKDESVTLSILEAIDGKDELTQRHLADDLGIALGLANSYLKRCVRKGLVKIRQVPPKRYLYYLTPKGFAEKSRLTAQYLSYSFEFYRRAGESCIKLFRVCAERKLNRILLCGVSELAEIASLRAGEHGLRIIGTYDPSGTRNDFLGQPVWQRFEDVPEFDACLLTALTDPLSRYNELRDRIHEDRLLVPDVLGLKVAPEERERLPVQRKVR